MIYWIIPWNAEKFDLTGCLERFNGEVDWRQNNNFDIGDIAFMYCALPVGRITYMCEIKSVCIPRDDTYDDEEFFRNDSDLEKEPKKGYARLKLIAVSKPTNKLTFHALVANGMKKNVQSPVRVTNSLLEYILSGFELEQDDNNPSKYIEGASYTVTQTLYERDPQTRIECLKHYGNKYRCEICGFSFKEVYGEIGNEFIHVHHINFLSNHKGKYVQTDPKKDLIPVCPNCHSMLHRKLNGKYLLPEELKKIMIS